LPEGSRAGDAITAAGGFASDADTTNLNRAAILADGQQVIVPFIPPDEPEEGNDALDAPGGVPTNADVSDGALSGEAPSIADAPSATDAPAANDAVGGLVNINIADEYALRELPDIGPVLARRIIDYREKHGPFANLNDIQKVEGIGPSTFAKIAPRIAV
jgi:competence protein ComEA